MQTIVTSDKVCALPSSCTQAIDSMMKIVDDDILW